MTRPAEPARVRLALALLETLPLEFVWGILGAVVGLYAFLAFGYVWPRGMTVLSENEVELGARTPLIAVAWLASAGLGALRFIVAWSALRQRLAVKLKQNASAH